MRRPSRWPLLALLGGHAYAAADSTATGRSPDVSLRCARTGSDVSCPVPAHLARQTGTTTSAGSRARPASSDAASSSAPPGVLTDRHAARAGRPVVHGHAHPLPVARHVLAVQPDSVQRRPLRRTRGMRQRPGRARRAMRPGHGRRRVAQRRPVLLRELRPRRSRRRSHMQPVRQLPGDVQRRTDRLESRRHATSAPAHASGRPLRSAASSITTAAVVAPA